MSYQVLARKYRPQRFADVAGQEHVTRTLLNALAQQRIAHGYIFSGHRGIGKTTIARILAQALNCRTEVGTEARPTPEPCGVCDSCLEIRAGNSVDVLEIDAATNRGIDEVRELREAARYRPARDKFKIWILDEAHQITDAAFNALLKTLEEPPDHVVFMMATTQPEDIPQTIRSRCQHFSFHAVKYDDILAQLQAIAVQEQIEAEPAALALLAEAGDGSMRDALSIMDQAIASAPLVEGKPRLEADQIRELMGSVPNTVFERLMEAISAGQTAAVIEEINTLLNVGNSPSALARQFVRYLRNTLMARIGGEHSDLLQISADERARAARSAMLFSEEDLTRFLQVMLRTFDDLNYRQEQRFHLELGLIKLVHLQRLLPVEELLSQLPAGSTSSGAPGSLGGTHRTVLPTARPAAQRPAPPAPAAPRPSPFEADRGRKLTGEPGSLERPGGPERPVYSDLKVTGPSEAEPQTRTGSGPASVLPAPRALSPAESAARAALTSKPYVPAEPASAVAVLEPPAEVAVEPALPEPAAIELELPGASEPEAEPLAEAQVAVDELPAPEPVPQEPAPVPEPAAVSAPAAPASDLHGIREALCSALDREGHNTAAALLNAGNWKQEGSTIQVEVAMRKAMLALTINADAETICRRALKAAGSAAKIAFLPGEAGGAGKPRAASAPQPSGAVQAEALENPLVKKAQELFQAEIRSVLDLRSNN